MVMKAYNKTIFRLFKGHFIRFLTLVAIVVVSIGFMFGVMEVQHKIDTANTENYQQYNVSDLYIKSKNMTLSLEDKKVTVGFNDDELNCFIKTYGEDHVEKSFSYEAKIDEDVVRLYGLNLKENKINKLQLLEGKLPSNSKEVVVERKTDKIKSYKVNDEINIMGQTFKVSGIVFNPLINNKLDEPSFQYEDECLANVIYFHIESFPFTIPKDKMGMDEMEVHVSPNDLHITLKNRDLFNGFSHKYKEEINKQKESILENLNPSSIEVLSLYENYGFYSLHEYGNKVNIIGIIFVVFFFVITLLIVDSTMTRLLDEERAQMACLKTLGYSDFKIIFKYLLFVSLATIIGGAIGLAVGTSLTFLVYNAFNIQYTLPSLPLSINFLRYFSMLIALLIGLIVLMLYASIKVVKQKPIQLLTPKAPKMGKKVIIEKISFIWKRLSFKYKSTCRNVLLFKNRFIMTVLSVIGCSVLVFAGFGLLDCSNNLPNGTTLITISVALIAFAAALCALVIYNLTNINVSERTREIATLMVLGYKDKEILGYIFREIYIMGFIGTIIGIPVGVLFIDFVFYLIDFGSLENINWWTYIISPLVTMIFCVIASLLLARKIIKTDMNASLKILE